MKLHILNEKNQYEEVELASDPQAYGYALVAFAVVALVAVMPFLVFWNLI